MDKALMAMSLEDDDDVPFIMPNLPEFSSTERNKRSLIGRLLNLDYQKMEEFIFQMPRKWQKQGRVRGIALSQERFQFIFDNEHDLVEVLEKGLGVGKVKSKQEAPTDVPISLLIVLRNLGGFNLMWLEELLFGSQV
ncbi:PREDICTED: uncharacterized protein LOC106323583 [Brassica oleracea var. oleracea]|uniref:uncharacterized protein LOC106323583 n=1 Tax=Brassica oleracea var. oleracea TaxID=109376 RepID=UPI0006A74B5D|nr:PREDICTED: uncharacterized protein LOC106323583 [Brassica oleracea var. oleracea]